MQTNQTPLKPATPLTVWILWFAILQGLGLIVFFVGGGIPSGPDRTPAPILFVGLATALVFLSLAVRFFVLPRIGTLQKKLPALLVGLALAEGAGFVAIFMIPAASPHTKLWMLAASFVTLLLHAPVYAKDTPLTSDSYQR